MSFLWDGSGSGGKFVHFDIFRRFFFIFVCFLRADAKELSDEDEMEHPNADGQTEDGGWEEGSEEVDERDAGCRGDEGVLGVAKDGGGAADVGRRGDTQSQWEELSFRPALSDELVEEEGTEDKCGGIVGDEGGHDPGKQTHPPQNGLHGLSLSKDVEGHHAEQSLAVKVVGHHHHSDQQEEGLQVPHLALDGVYLVLSDDVEDDHEGSPHQGSRRATQREVLGVQHHKGPHHKEDDGAHDLDVEAGVVLAEGVLIIPRIDIRPIPRHGGCTPAEKGTIAL